MRRICLSAVFFLFCCTNIFAQTQTVGLFTRVNGSIDSGFILFPPYQNCDTTYLIDRCGKLVHKWPSAYTPGAEAYLLADGSLLRCGHYPNTIFDSCGCGIGGIIERIDWSGNVVWHYVISDTLETQNHAICPLPNGNILVDIWENIEPAEAVANGRDPLLLGTRLYSPKVIEIKPKGTDAADVVWTWRLWDHLVQQFDPTKLNYGTVSDHPELVNLNYVNLGAGPAKDADWTHLNAIDYNPLLDQVMLSFRNFCEIIVLDHTTDAVKAAHHKGGKYGKGGDLLYRWGNPEVYGHGSIADMKLFYQHDPSWITNGKYAGKIMIFNNGLHRPGADGTTIDIIDPPVDTGGNYIYMPGSAFDPSAAVWSYPSTPSTSFFATNMGTAQITPNGDVFINLSSSGKFIEIDSSKNIVWQYVSPVANGMRVQQYKPSFGNAVYRAIFYPADYAAFLTHSMDPAYPIERDPIATSCDTSVVVITGTQLLTQQQDYIAVYPNPATHIITVQTNEATMSKVWITDITGRVLISKEQEAEKLQLDISALAPGIYLLKAEHTNGLISQTKLVKQ